MNYNPPDASHIYNHVSIHKHSRISGANLLVYLKAGVVALLHKLEQVSRRRDDESTQQLEQQVVDGAQEVRQSMQNLAPFRYLRVRRLVGCRRV